MLLSGFALFCLLSAVYISVCMQWYLVLIYISLLIKYIDHLFMYLLTFCVSSRRKVCFQCLAEFLKGCKNVLTFPHLQSLSTPLMVTFETERILMHVMHHLHVFRFALCPLCVCAIFKTPLSYPRLEMFTVSFLFSLIV